MIVVLSPILEHCRCIAVPWLCHSWARQWSEHLFTVMVMFRGLRWLQSLEGWLQELFSEEGMAYLISSSEKAEVQIGKLKNELSLSVELPYTTSLPFILSTLKKKLKGKWASFSLIKLLTSQCSRIRGSGAWGASLVLVALITLTAWVWVALTYLGLCDTICPKGSSSQGVTNTSSGCP